ncbi:MAG TPA: amidohydrolase/deacetylase family metallohydrolase, partial [Firmicutes bacterium]|nr:amidohydrolase/deacetylase family metallohydrolase [Bacillota bacterium]
APAPASAPAPVPAPRPVFDTIFTGGTVVDPAQNIYEEMEVGVKGTRIAALGKELARSPWTKVVDCRGLIITPGLIDLHVHVYPGATPLGIDPDEVMLVGGVTTMVDAGSAGSSNWPGLRDQVVLKAKPQILSLIHLSAIGLAASDFTGELLSPILADPEGAAQVLLNERALAVGVKLRAGAHLLGEGDHAWQLLRRAAKLARDTGTWLMVHVGNTPMSLPELVAELAPGDVITHCYKGGPYGHKVLDEHGRVWPALKEAAAAGIIFDVGHGAGSFGWEVAAQAIEQGFLPQVISTDLHYYSLKQPVGNLPLTMTKFILLGLSLPEVIARCTAAPAAVLGREKEIGSLLPGSTADITLLRWREESISLYDCYGEVREADRYLECAGVMRAGVLYQRDDGAAKRDLYKPPQ